MQCAVFIMMEAEEKIKDKPVSAHESSVFDFQLQVWLFSWHMYFPFSVSIILIIKNQIKIKIIKIF